MYANLAAIPFQRFDELSSFVKVVSDKENVQRLLLLLWLFITDIYTLLKICSYKLRFMQSIYITNLKRDSPSESGAFSEINSI